MMEGEERALFARGIGHAVAQGSGAQLDAALDDLGWVDALEVDRPAAVSLLFDAQGRAHAGSGALDALLAVTLGADGSPAVVLPPLRSGTAPAAGGVVRGLGTAALARSERAVVVTHSDDGHVAHELDTARLTLRPVEGVDPALGLVEVSGAVGAAPGGRAVEWDSAVALARLALAHELVGAGRAMLELARLHALERVQFGRPIATFQAVRHKLAETFIALEAADSLLEGAWDEVTPVAAAMAKGMAGRSARTAAKHCQQVLAGIGFTAEHPLHLYVARVLVLDQLFGTGRDLTRQLGADVLATGSLPPAFVL